MVYEATLESNKDVRKGEVYLLLPLTISVFTLQTRLGNPREDIR